MGKPAFANGTIFKRAITQVCPLGININDDKFKADSKPNQEKVESRSSLQMSEVSQDILNNFGTKKAGTAPNISNVGSSTCPDKNNSEVSGGNEDNLEK